MTLGPFLYLGIGAALGFSALVRRFIKTIDAITTIVLIILLITVGAKIGINGDLMTSAGKIGLQCALICAMAVAGSVLFAFLLEKTFLPLDKLKIRLEMPDEGSIIDRPPEKAKVSPLVWLIPSSILVGIVLGYSLLPDSLSIYIDISLNIALNCLFVCVGINMAYHREIFKYFKMLGYRIVFLSVAIITGSLSGGFLAALILNVKFQTSVLSSLGMGYYSLCGAWMTETMGIEAGAYGFLVNVIREFSTILFMPLLARLNKSASIASAGATAMDTMLVPITKLLGHEVGLVSFITGVILTFVLPFLLPITGLIFK
ncbi:MAG: hypothetical protein BWY11_00941 [Firmicutes bacterium ADurb.Bin182]|nr:MAG: hypothetical protein BWY11_00941 [Firmicutes bacterium ADurb.Bin182]